MFGVTLAETNFATEVADRWINSGKELYISAAGAVIAGFCERVKYAMNEFVIAIEKFPICPCTKKRARRQGNGRPRKSQL